MIADVNTSNTINAGDALLIMRKFTGLYSAAWNVDDWYIDDINSNYPPPVDSPISQSTVSTYYLSEICYGDVNYDVFGLTQDEYRNTPILSFQGSRLISSAMFILRKADLPIISTKQISPEQIEKYSLKKVSETIDLYASVIDLNDTKPEILEEMSMFGRHQPKMIIRMDIPSDH